MASQRRAAVIGLGLIGGSVSLALREQGWHVTGEDSDTDRSSEALDNEVVDAVGTDPDAEITFIATPVGSVAEVALEALERSPTVVTDVGSVKASIADRIDDPRFVAGHPMAGSELEGLAGARADMFSGAVWVLAPRSDADDSAFALVRGVVSSFGAEVITLEPRQHDRLVAVVSHVPHLTAAALMELATARADEHQALLRLAAGGFRDMTRIASGHPGIWPDICDANAEAIVDTLDTLIDGLQTVRQVVDTEDRPGLLAMLESAREGRTNLPSSALQPASITELRIPVLDQPGELASICTLADELGVNIFDLEIAHSAEGIRGVVVVMVSTDLAGRLHTGLVEKGYRPSLRPLT